MSGFTRKNSVILAHATAPKYRSLKYKQYRHHAANLQIATISRFSPNYKYPKKIKEREPCPIPPPPPPPPPKDDKLLWGTITLLFLAGGFVVYAKSSPEIRDWLTLNAPIFDDIIAILYEENMTYKEFATACLEDLKKYIASFSDEKLKECSLDGKAVLNYDVPEKKDESDEDKQICEPEPPPVVTQNICDIEKCIRELSESALNNYCTAKQACAVYNSLVEDTMTTFSYPEMKGLRHAMEEREMLVKTSLDNAGLCMHRLDELVRYLDCGVQATHEQIKYSKKMHRDYQTRFKGAFIEYQWANDKALALDRQWQMVEELLDGYTNENKCLYPELNYMSETPIITGDTDMMLYNSYRYMNKLNDELKDVSEAMTERVNRAMENLPQCEDKVKARAAKLEAAVKNKRVEVEKEIKRREDEQKARNVKKLKERCKQQLDRHEESMALQVANKEAEIMAKFDSLVKEKVAKEKRLFTHQLDDMAAQLKIVENKLNARLKAERETRRSQELWAAGASLLEATKKGEPKVRVNKELKAIEKASGQNDKLVATVLDSISQNVRDNGIVPESVLRDGFHAMEKTARNVALIEQDGSAMHVYIMSWLQALLLFMRISGIPQAEYEKPPLEPPHDLDTFDLLQRARFWMEQGNLAAAVRYVGWLKGASRAAAAKWYDAARSHLEVRQAAEAVLAHAAAMGLQYI